MQLLFRREGIVLQIHDPEDVEREMMVIMIIQGSRNDLLLLMKIHFYIVMFYV